MKEDEAFFIMNCLMNGTPLEAETVRRVMLEWWEMRSTSSTLQPRLQGRLQLRRSAPRRPAK